jgi:hypothetical protein
VEREGGKPSSVAARVATASDLEGFTNALSLGFRDDQGEDTNAERLALLVADREAVLAQLEDTPRNLDLIESKINFYRERLEQQ